MKLYRKELIDFEEKWLNIHPNKNNSPMEYKSFLNGLNDIISKHDYEVDERFVTYGRRDFLRMEFSDYLNERVYCGRGKYNDAFVDLAEYYSANIWIDRIAVPKDKDFKKLEQENDKYKEDGIICTQEILIIKEMIDEFRFHLDKLTIETNDE